MSFTAEEESEVLILSERVLFCVGDLSVQNICTLAITADE